MSNEPVGDPTFGGYQDMGLSNRQNGILRDVVNAAHEEGRRNGTAGAWQLIEPQANTCWAEPYSSAPSPW